MKRFEILYESDLYIYLYSSWLITRITLEIFIGKYGT